SHLSLRAGRKSTIITSNLSFLKWQEIFHDPVLTAALTDRLTHKSHVVNMVGPSYRMKETEQWIKDNSKMTVAQFYIAKWLTFNLRNTILKGIPRMVGFNFIFIFNVVK